MATVYSAPLYATSGLSGAGPSIVTPADETYIVRDIDTYASAGTDEIVIRFIDDVTGGTIWTVSIGPEASSWEGWRGRQVFPPGSAWHMETTNGPADVRVSGYILSA